MKDLITWYHSVPTAQILLEGKLDLFFRELLTRWKTKDIVKQLSASRETLKKRQKRAKSLVGTWRKAFEEELRSDSLSRKDKERVEEVLHRVRTHIEGAMAWPPRRPALGSSWGYRELIQGIPKHLRSDIKARLRQMPVEFHNLDREEKANPWLAAKIAGELLDPAGDHEFALPWISSWRRDGHPVINTPVISAWTQWTRTRSGALPESVASFVQGVVDRAISALSVHTASDMDVGAAQVLLAQHAAMPQPDPLDAPVTRPDPDREYGIKEAAEVFGVPEWRLRKAVQDRELKCRRPTRAPNAPIRLRDATIRDWLRSREGKIQLAPRNPNLPSL